MESFDFVAAARDAELFDKIKNEKPRYPFISVFIELAILATCVYFLGASIAALLAICYVIVQMPYNGIGLMNLLKMSLHYQERIEGLEAKVAELERRLELLQDYEWKRR